MTDKSNFPEPPNKSIMDNQSLGNSPTLKYQGFTQSNEFQNRSHTYKKGSYVITDLGWLPNLKLISALNGKKLGDKEENEVDMCIVSYNSSFSNLKLSLRNFTGKKGSRYYINLEDWKQVTQINLGSEAAFEIKSNINNIDTKIPIIERLFSANSGWSPNETDFMWCKDKIHIRTRRDSNIYIFNFFDWQVEFIKTCLEFMTNGQSWSANLQTIMNKKSVE